MVIYYTFLQFFIQYKPTGIYPPAYIFETHITAYKMKAFN